MHSRPNPYAIAPMMGWSTQHFRYWLSLLFRDVDIYTEMITANAIVFGDHARLLADRDPKNRVLQLGGSDPKLCAKAANLAYGAGYRHLNLNVGCPSDRVQNALIGACLMKHAQTVAEVIKAMQVADDVLVSVKCRIGVDEHDSPEFLEDFIGTVSEAGCRTFFIHARKAWLTGLSPRQNRDIPPLIYDRVFLMKKLFPDHFIGINGGIKTLEAAHELLAKTDQVMFGRLAIERQRDLVAIAKNKGFLEREPVQLFSQYLAYLQEMRSEPSMYFLLQPIMPLLHDFKGARELRRSCGQLMQNRGDVVSFFEKLIEVFPD